MKIHDCKQNTPEWLIARAGVVTASEVDALVTPLWKIRTGDGPRTYLAQKLGEKWTGGPIADFMNLDMEAGRILEEQAIPFFEGIHEVTIERVGLITTDDGRLGCSPDGLIGDDCGIEVKCPGVKNHTKYLLAGEIPADYLAQVHFSMFVTGRPRWTFVSYHRKMPMLVKQVERDEEIIETIKTATNIFLEQMDEGWKRLVELNGGKEPKHFTVKTAEPYDYAKETGDVMP